MILCLFILSSCSTTPSVPGGSGDVEGFTPEQNCLHTLGDWIKVPPDQYPENPVAGVFDPDKHPDYNYRCVCPEGSRWTTIGCQ